MASINNSLFSYPILCSYNDDYNNIKFIAGTTGELTKTNKISKIKTYVEIEDEIINKMLDSNELKIIIKVFCFTTKYRKIFEISRGFSEIILNNKDINKNVEFDTYIVANEDISDFSSPNFNDDYRGMKFNLERGSIVGVGKSENIFFEKDIDDFTKIDSVIKVRDIKKDNEPMTVTFDEENIKINLSTSDYKIYCLYSEYCIPIVNSMIIIPGLMFVLDQLCLDDIDLNDYINKKWYRVLSKKVYEATGKKFSIDYIKLHGPLEIIQKLFDNPLHDAMNEIEKKYGGNSSNDN